MEQISLLSQYDIEKGRFIELFSKFTGISKSKISNFLEFNSISNIFKHPTSLEITETQREKINQLRELKNLYKNLKSHDKEYIIDSTTKAGQYFKEYFSGTADKELFVCSLLDNGNRIITTKIMSTGTVNEAAVYPREIAKIALLYDTNCIILAHNHPGGSLRPSQADLNVTTKIANALSVLNIKILDHIIVADDKYRSFAEEGISLSPNLKISEIDNVKENIIELYHKEFPAIRYISNNTVEFINNTNQKQGKVVSIKELKEAYKQAGELLDKNNNPGDKKVFDTLQKVVDDLKQAQLKEMQFKGQKRAIQNQLDLDKTIEII